jgi:CheY-like chemotaxis protein
MTERCLGQFGCHLTTAASAVDALAVWEREHGQFDLVLTDVVMPNGVSGVELVRRIREMNPHARFLLMSGCPADAGRLGAIGSGMPFLPKPFSVAQLRSAVRDALGH